MEKVKSKSGDEGYNEPPLYVSENHFDRRYDDLDPRLIPKGENLGMVVERITPFGRMMLFPSFDQEKMS